MTLQAKTSNVSRADKPMCEKPENINRLLRQYYTETRMVVGMASEHYT